MPKFYFHLRGDGQNFNDPDGLDYASLADAERAAVRAAALIVEREGDEISGWFEILDESGNLQEIIPLQTVLLAKAA